MAKIEEELTVLVRVTNAEWGRRAAAVAMMLYEAGACPKRVEVRRYPGDAPAEMRIASGYDALLGAQTEWVLSIDADSWVYGDVGELVREAKARHDCYVALRKSPLQLVARDGWREDLYRELFVDLGLPYRDLGTTCAFLLHGGRADRVLGSVALWRKKIDSRGEKLSRSYHHAQAAFALALAHADVGEEATWWWGPEQLSFAGEPHGIIHHEAHKSYRFPYQRKDGT